MRPAPENIPPLLYGPDEVTEGYYLLEELERAMSLEALSTHREPAEIWYRFLTLYRRGMTGEWDFSNAEDDDVKRQVWGLQSQLLGLGVSSAKAALDMLLAGYYSMAFAAIRHMLETFVQYCYVAVTPMEAVRWYEQPGGPDAQAQTPGCKRMLDVIKQNSQLGLHASFYDSIYDSWKLMSKGSHPSGQGITQTRTSDEAKLLFGATYHEKLCLAGFDHGLYAVDKLLHALVSLREQSDEWKLQFTAVRTKTTAWRAAMRAREDGSDESKTRPSDHP